MLHVHFLSMEMKGNEPWTLPKIWMNLTNTFIERSWKGETMGCVIPFRGSSRAGEAN